MASTHPSVLIVGVGNMGGALVHGLFRSGLAIKVRVHDVHEDRVRQLAASHPVERVDDLSQGPLADEAIVLCTKPQDLEMVAAKIAGRIAPTSLVLTLAAGVPMEEVGTLFAHRGALVRVMPNIAATVGEAATAMCANDICNEGQRKLAETIFSAVGEAYWTKESLLDAVTGLSGSGPAYIYMVIEALTDGGVKMGIPRELAAKLATQTVLGSAALVKATGLHPAILKDQVTTPGGTTINAIHELEAHGLRAMLISAVATATERAAHLRQSRPKARV